MSDKSAIEWTDATWNPTTGCDRVSPGCANCYAMALAPRLKRMGAPAYQNDGDPKTSGPGFALTLHPERLDIPLRWKRPRRIFVDSMSDLFHPDVPDEFLARVFATMALARQHTFQVLTKRPERMRSWLSRVAYCEHGWLTHNGDNPSVYRSTISGREDEAGTGVIIFDGRDHLASTGAYTSDGRAIVGLVGETRWPLPNVWLGTSVENARWRTRIGELRQTPAAVRFLSCEPILGPLNDDGALDLAGIDWVIAGGESGRDFRAVDPEWIRQLRDECIRQGVPFLFKQWGGRTSKSGGRELDGQTSDAMPA